MLTTAYILSALIPLAYFAWGAWATGLIRSRRQSQEITR